MRVLVRGISGLLVAAALGWGGFGLAAGPAEPGPDALVRELYRTWIDAVKAGGERITADKEALYALTDRTTAPFIDYTRLSRLVLGRYWRQASETQRRRFIAEFRRHLVRTYATALVRYVDAEFVFKPTRYRPEDKQVMVRTVTVPRDGSPKFPVNYLLYRDAAGWKAMDVIIEGVSIVATLRNVVASEIQRKTLDGVIEELARKNRGGAK